MINARTCVICDRPILPIRKALVAPFLATRIWDRAPFEVDLVQCAGCGFMFYNPRLDSAEEARLYKGYRSIEYQQMRHGSEPWYTAKFNADLASASFFDFRRRKLASILREHLGDHEIRRVLDYGGDRGDLVQGLVEGAAAFVYDISGISPVEGVTLTTSPAECRPDLIVNSNVLEHVGFPDRLVRELVSGAHAGSFIFLEVPCESPFGLGRILRRIVQIGIIALTRPNLATRMVRPSALYLMHEHINYFSEVSLRTLMHLCGCSITATGKYVLNGRAGKGTMAWCLGTAGPAPTPQLLNRGAVADGSYDAL